MSLKSIQKWVKNMMVAGMALAGTMFQANGCTIQVDGLNEFLNGIGTQLDFSDGEAFADDGSWDWYPTWDSTPSYSSGSDAGSACAANR